MFDEVVSPNTPLFIRRALCPAVVVPTMAALLIPRPNPDPTEGTKSPKLFISCSRCPETMDDPAYPTLEVKQKRRLAQSEPTQVSKSRILQWFSFKRNTMDTEIQSWYSTACNSLRNRSLQSETGVLNSARINRPFNIIVPVIQ